MKKIEFEQNVRNTKSLDEWLVGKGEFLLCQYDEYVKYMIRSKNTDEILSLSDWLIKNDIKLFNEYDAYVEGVLRFGI